jgi:hypothetical protein
VITAFIRAAGGNPSNRITDRPDALEPREHLGKVFDCGRIAHYPAQRNLTAVDSDVHRIEDGEEHVIAKQPLRGGG